MLQQQHQQCMAQQGMTQPGMMAQPGMAQPGMQGMAPQCMAQASAQSMQPCNMQSPPISRGGGGAQA